MNMHVYTSRDIGETMPIRRNGKTDPDEGTPGDAIIDAIHVIKRATRVDVMFEVVGDVRLYHEVNGKLELV